MAGSLTGCALYHARPLPQRPDLSGRVRPLRGSVRGMALPGLKPHRFDLAAGLDMTDVAILAVLNSPALRTARAEARAGRAQAFVAGLLPGPQVSYSLDHPTDQGPQYTNAYSAGLAYDLTAIITHGAAEAAARANAKQVNLELLWQEWQVAQQARVLYVDCLENRRKLALLTALQGPMNARYRDEQHAYAAGDLTVARLGLDLAALQDVESLRASVATARVAGCRSLNESLGLKPGVHLKLAVDPRPMTAPTAGQLHEALTTLPRRRPDLLALRYGYESADQAVWRAVLAQFPDIGFGIDRGQDTTDVHTIGFAMHINFPFLAGGQAAVHAADATRTALGEQYQQRLDEAVSDVRLIEADLRILDDQRRQIHATSADTQRLLARARTAYDRGNLTAPAYYGITLAALNQQLTRMTVEAQQQRLEIGLQTLLGLPPEDLQRSQPEEAP